MKQRPFVALWTIAVSATVAAFVLHLALRGRTVDLGYRLGRARAEQARLREVKRVLSLEAASYQTPQRVEMVARSLLGMTPPPPERVIALRAPASTLPPDDKPQTADESTDVTSRTPVKASASAAASGPPAVPSAARAVSPAPKPKSDDPYDDPGAAP